MSLLFPSHSGSVIPVHASMLCLSCPCLRAMAMPPPASGLAPWKFVLSSHLTDAAVRTYFAFLYTPCIDVIQTVHLLFLVTIVFLAVTRKWCKPHYQHRHQQQQQQQPKLVQPPHFRIMQVHQPDQICKHECMSHMPSRNPRFHVDHGLPHWAP